MVYFACLEAFEHVGGRPVTVTVREDEGALSFEVVEVVEVVAALHGGLGLLRW